MVPKLVSDMSGLGKFLRGKGQVFCRSSFQELLFIFLKPASREMQTRALRKPHFSLSVKESGLLRHQPCKADFRADLLRAESSWWSQLLQFVLCHFSCSSALLGSYQHRFSSSLTAVPADSVPCVLHLWAGLSCCCHARCRSKETMLKRFFCNPAARILLINNLCSQTQIWLLHSSGPFKAVCSSKAQNRCWLRLSQGQSKENRWFFFLPCFGEALMWLGPVMCTGGVRRRKVFSQTPLHAVWIGLELCLLFKEEFWKKQNHDDLICSLQKKSWSSAFVTEDLFHWVSFIGASAGLWMLGPSRCFFIAAVL